MADHERTRPDDDASQASGLSEPHVAITGERMVLNGSQDPQARPLAEQARMLVAVAQEAGGLDREGVLDRVRQVLDDGAGREVSEVEVDRHADTLMRAARSSLSVETDTGEVLATYTADGGEPREEPGVSDPADEDRPFYS